MLRGNIREMGAKMTRKLILACAVILVMAPDVHGRDDAQSRLVYDVTLNDFVTRGLLRDIESIRSECFAADRIYRLDCLRQGLDQVSRRTPYHGEYGAMRNALRSGSAAVAPVIDSNTDDSLKRLEVKPGTNPRFKSRRYYTPVAAGRFDDAKAEAFKALDGTQSNLLEIGKRSATWNKTYTTIAIAVASLADVLRK
jgi:hypothetical protein